MHKKNIIWRLIFLILGLYLCSLGLTFFYFNGLGLDAWNVLHEGISNITGLKFGYAFIVVSFAMLGIALLMGEKLGIGTIANAYLMGNFLQFNIDSGILNTPKSPYVGILFIIIGMIITGFGYYFYMGVGLGSGPRDSFIMAVSRRTNIKIGYLKSITEVVAIIIGIFLGGRFGLGTVIIAIFTGIIIQKVFDFLKFNPQVIQQESLKDTLNKLKK